MTKRKLEEIRFGDILALIYALADKRLVLTRADGTVFVFDGVKDGDLQVKEVNLSIKPEKKYEIHLKITAESLFRDKKDIKELYEIK